MATQTDHMKLTKPAYTDSADIAVINSNMDAIDTATSKILPVISGTTNNSGYTIASGEYFEANGKLYKANASIPQNQAWSSSATEQSDHGAINALNGKITDVQSIDCTFANTITADNFAAKKIGKLVIVCGGITSKTSDPVVFNHGEQIITSGLPPCSYNPVFMGLTYMSGSTQREQYRLRIVGGTLIPFYDSITVPKNGMALYVNICYFADN